MKRSGSEATQSAKETDNEKHNNNEARDHDNEGRAVDMRQSGGSMRFTAGIIIGGLLGAMYMLFFPPKNAPVFRNVVRRKVGGAKRVAQRSVRRVQRQSTRLLENAKRSVESLGKSVVGPNGQVTVGRTRLAKQRSR